MTADNDTTESLLRLARRGDRSAAGALAARHRDRLRHVIAVRLDPRLAARVDASDIVQETLAEAMRKLRDDVQDRHIPFFVWLRQLAVQRVADQFRRHVVADRRSVNREVPQLSDESVMQLADRLPAGDTSPSGRLMREEKRCRVRAALDNMPPRDREVLVLRYLEQLSNPEIAAILGVSERSVRSRHRQALEHLGRLLLEHDQGDQS